VEVRIIIVRPKEHPFCLTETEVYLHVIPFLWCSVEIVFDIIIYIIYMGLFDIHILCVCGYHIVMMSVGPPMMNGT
jgi:hypothetical protein